MADQRIIGKSAQLQGQPITASEPTRGSVVPSEPPPAELSARRPETPGVGSIQRVRDLPGGEFETGTTPLEGDVCLPLSGRAQTPSTTGIRAVQLFCRVANQPVANPTTIDPVVTEVINGVSQRENNPRLWLARTFGEDNMVINGPPAVGGVWPSPRVAGFVGNFSARSWLHARVRWEAPGTSGVFDMDLGGPPIELWATYVQINILAPMLHQEILEGTVNPWISGNTTINCWTDATLEVLPIEEARGNRITTLTMRQEALANTAIAFEVPAFAKRVTLYQSGAGAAAVAFTFELGPLNAGSLEIGTLPFIAGARRTNQIDVIPGTTHILSDIDQNNARLFTAVWEIEP